MLAEQEPGVGAVRVRRGAEQRLIMSDDEGDEMAMTCDHGYETKRYTEEADEIDTGNPVANMTFTINRYNEKQ